MKFLFIIVILFMAEIYAKTIANIPEASGICFILQDNILVVVNDEGYIYKLTKKGIILEKKYLGEYDLEGVAFNEETGDLLVVVEDINSIFILDKITLEIKKKIKIKGKYDKKSGLEGIAVLNGKAYLSNQSKTFIFKVNLDKNKAKINKKLKHGYKDISGLNFHDGFLYMVNDTKNLLIKYDYKKKKIIKKVKLPTSAQEGICFDKGENIYIADDEGQILKYKAKKLGF